MIAGSDQEEEAKIFAPDFSLWKKLGNVNLDQIFTPKVIDTAQEVIAGSSDVLLDEVVSELKKLDAAGNELISSHEKWRQTVPEIIASAFAIKTKTGLGGYELVAAIAKSLQLFCERLEGENLPAKSREIIGWHIDGIKRLLALKVEGAGGRMGEEILAEMDKIKRQ